MNNPPFKKVVKGTLRTGMQVILQTDFACKIYILANGDGATASGF